MRALFITLPLAAVALIAITACAERAESTAVTIPTATPASTPTPPPPTATAIPSATPVPVQPTSTPRPAKPTPTPTATPTATPTPEPSLATAKSAALLVNALGVPASTVTFESVKPVQWPNTALGCPEPGKAYAEVIVPGWMIILRTDSKLYEYHADREGNQVVTCDPKLVRTYGTANLSEDLMLANVSTVEVLAIDPSNPTPAPAVTVTSSADIGRLVASLHVDLPVREQKRCEPLLQINFVMGGRVESLLYACPGDGTVLRATKGAVEGREVTAPVDFQTVINKALADRPFPALPDK